MRTPRLHGMEEPSEEEREPSIPKRWRWHYQALTSLRARLMEERREHLHQGSEPADRPSLHLADAATDQFDQDLALGLLSAEQDALYEVDAALDRIHRGTYGTCEETRVPIPEERLKAVPWTRYCEEASARRELPHPHLGELRSVREGAPVLASGPGKAGKAAQPLVPSELIAEESKDKSET